MRGNKAQIGWIEANGVRLDRRDTDAGDTFACRYEAYLTDYRVEPRKSVWEVALAIRVADDQP